MIALIESWARRFPILSIEDPVAQDDTRAMATMTKSLAPQCQIIGDDFLVTDPDACARRRPNAVPAARR